MPFALGQHVVIRSDRKCFGGVTGTIADPPEWLADAGGNEGSTAARCEKRRDGLVVVYWVEFDFPTEDAGGGGSFMAAAIEEQSLELLGDRVTRGLHGRPSMQLVF